MKHIINARTSITNTDEKLFTPNAIDLKIQKVLALDPYPAFVISETEKHHRKTTEVPVDENDFWTLFPGTYEIVLDHIVKVGDREAGWVITRSTLNRNGVFITTGLYDTGYEGPMAAALHVTTGPCKIQKGTRVAQYLTFDAETLFDYQGSYGLGTEHDQKRYGV